MDGATNNLRPGKLARQNTTRPNGALPWAGSHRRTPGAPRQVRPPSDLKSIFPAASRTRNLAGLIAEFGDIREQERKQIADDLHDYLGQNLILMAMKLGMLESSASDLQTGAIRELRRLVGQCLGQVRSLVNGLHSHELRNLDFVAAFNWLVEQVHTLYGLRCAVDFPAAPVRLDREDQETLLLAVRELIINVAKHASVSAAQASVRCDGGQIIVVVADKGSGFDPGRPRVSGLRSGGFGLMSLRERIGRLGGSLQIDSRPGDGTRATITLPVRPR